MSPNKLFLSSPGPAERLHPAVFGAHPRSGPSEGCEEADSGHEQGQAGAVYLRQVRRLISYSNKTYN